MTKRGGGSEGGYHFDTGCSQESMGWKMGLLRDSDNDDIVMSGSGEEKEDSAKESDAGSLHVGVPNSPAYSTRKRTAQSPKEKDTPSPVAGGAKKKSGRGKKK